MKIAIVSILIGAAAAFSPAQPSRVSTQLNAAAVAAQPSFGFFDLSEVGKIANADSVEETKIEKPVTVFNSYQPAPILEDVTAIANRAFSPAYVFAMKCVSSIGAMKRRSKTCQVVRRRGRIYVIDKKNPRNKVRQGGAKMKKRQKK